MSIIASPRSLGDQFGNNPRILCSALGPTSGLARPELDDVRFRDDAVLDRDGGYGLQFVETDPSGGARVEIEDGAAELDEGSVAVAEHDYLCAIVRAGTRELVDNMEAHAA